MGMTYQEALKVVAARDTQPPERVKEAARVILEHRRARDPIYQVKLTPTQDAFITSKTRYKLLSSVNRGGKTSCIAFKLARTVRRLDPIWSVPPEVKGIYCIFAPRRDQIVDPWYKKLCVGSEFKGGPWENEPLIPEREIKKVYYTHGGGKPTPKVIELHNGHSIWCGVSGDKHAWEGLEGKGMVLGIALDESAGTQQLIDECMVRLLDAHSHPIVKATCGGGWLDWGATETKVNDAFSTFRAKAQDDQCPDYAEFVIPPDENPAIDPAEREKYKQVLSDEVYATRMAGEGGALNALLVYPQFDDTIHWCDDPYEVTDEDTIFIGWDPGVNVSGHVYVAYNKDNPRVGHVFAAKEMKRATLAAEAQMMRHVTLGRRIEWIAYDQAARKIEKTSGSSAIWQLQAELKRAGVQIEMGTMKGRSNYGDSVPVVRQMLNDRRIILHKGAEILRSQMKTHRFTERGGELREDNIQKGNDHCFVAGTMVWTPVGHRPIESLRVGDLVYTRHGPRPIAATHVTHDQPVMLVGGDGWELIGTPNHPVLSGGTWKRLDALRYADSLATCPNAPPIPSNPSPSMASPSGAIRSPSNAATVCTSRPDTHTVSVASGDITKNSGSPSTGTSRTDTISTTSTGIRSITISAIWRAWTVASTPATTSLRTLRNTVMRCAQTLTAFVISLLRGIAAQMEKLGTDSMPRLSPSCVSPSQQPVWSVASNSTTGHTGHPHAQTTAGRSIGVTQALMTSTEIAQYAERHSASTNTPGSVIAPVRVEHIRALPHTATVYNITVLDCPEYFANGILVHNCADAARYIMSTGPYWRQRPRNPARLKADGGELQFAQDRQTPTEEELNIREHMRISKLYAEGRLPGWT